MRISPEHGRAWGYWHTPEVLRKAARMHAPDIHQLVNLHAGPPSRETGADALGLVRLKRKNALADRSRPCNMAEVLTPSQWCRENAPKRYCQMRRWLRRLLRQREWARNLLA